MPYCPECGAIIAPTDTFCQICGIALTPVAVPVQEEAVTNVTADESKSVLQPKEVKSSVEESPPPPDWLSPSEEPKPEKPAATKTGKKESTRNLKKSVDEVPTPAFLADVSGSKESLPTTPETSEVVSEIPAPVVETAKTNQIVNEQQETKEDVSSWLKEDHTEEHLAEWLEEKENQRASFVQEVIAQTENAKDEVKSETAGGMLEPTIAQNFGDNFLEKSDVHATDSPNQPFSEKPEILSVQDIIVSDNLPTYSTVSEEEAKAIEMGAAQAQLAQDLIREESLIEKGVESTPEKKKTPTKRNLNVEDTAGNKSVKLKTMAEGTILNRRYEIIRRIGGGGMGAVYLASDKNLGGVLRAVKEMIQAYVDEEQQQKAIDDFKRESLLLTSLEHPSIPTIYDYFFDETAGRFYLVMKYISGGDLAARLRAAPEGRIDERSVTEWGLQIADVLDYLHNHNPPIIYRDLKPANIMLDGNNGRAMLIDFGIARWLNAEEKGVTAVGTMGYAPPELFSGQADNRSDIYSLGATMFHLLTGSDPQNNPLLIFDFNKNPRPRQINPLISNEMEQIILRAVEYNPSLRYSTASEMRENLFEHTERIRSGRLTFSYTGSGSVAQPVVQQNLVFCGFCGEKIIPTDMFCAYCGTKQPLQDAPVSSPIAQPRYTARVVILGTSEINPPAIFLEKDNNLVGRKDPHSNIFPEVDLSRYDPQVKVSRRHARIWLQGENYMIEDLGSSNGTMLVNNLNEAVRLFPHQPHVLTHGDKLKLGETTLHFFAG